MTSKNSIIKNLRNELSNTQNINKPDATTAISSQDEKPNNSSDITETIIEHQGAGAKTEAPKLPEIIKDKPGVKKQDINYKAKTSLEVKDVSFFIKTVKEWERAESSGKRNLIHLDERLNSYLGIVKVATGIPAVQFVNFVVAQFLINNPDFMNYVSNKTGANPYSEEAKE